MELAQNKPIPLRSVIEKLPEGGVKSRKLRNHRRGFKFERLQLEMLFWDHPMHLSLPKPASKKKGLTV